ncbi:MAG TPA: glycosyltransferase [Chthoniobacterales bacterium]
MKGDNSMTTRRNIVFFRAELLRYSETFIREQAEGLPTLQANYTGFRRVPGLDLPEDRVYLAPYPKPFDKPVHILHKLGLPHPRLAHKLAPLRPLALHAHFEEGGIHALYLARALRVPLVTTCHGFDVTVENAHRPWKERLCLGRLGQLHREGSLFLAVSRFIQKKMIERGYPQEKVRVHYIGVDPTKFQLSGLVEKEPIILFVGRLVGKKGADDLLAAAALLKEQGVSFQVVLIGQGPLEESLRQQAAAMKIPAQFPGKQTPEEIKMWMERASVFCVPSKEALHGDSEGFGMVFGEAQAMKLPVVSTRHGGIPEAVEDTVTGFLAQEGNPKELATFLRRLLEDSTLARQMGEKGRERVVTHFDLHKQCAELEKIYLETFAK